MEVSEKDRLDQITRRIIGAASYRLDLVGEDAVIVEWKAVEQLTAIFEAQLLSYLRLTSKRVRLLINFHVPVLKNRIKRIVNDFPDDKAFSANSASRR